MTDGQSAGDTEREAYGNVLLFRVLFNEDRTRIDTNHDVMGWGIRFPTGWCYVDWNREAYPLEDRLDEPHVSIYGNLDDVEQGTGGDIDIMHKQKVEQEVGE
jgi:hypothetical protein